MGGKKSEVTGVQTIITVIVAMMLGRSRESALNALGSILETHDRGVSCA